jgi:SAM-dependent methyltransferase
MKLNPIELVAMNNPIRRWVQNHIEFKIFVNLLKRHKIKLNQSIILDAGCGSGYSSQLLSQKFQPKVLISFDYMKEQVQQVSTYCPSALFFQGDVCNIGVASESMDVVFIFGLLHHVEYWKRAILELHRVLKPDGIMVLEEPNIDGTKLFQKLFRFQFPEGGKFQWVTFEDKITQNFKILSYQKIIFDCYRAYICQKK